MYVQLEWYLYVAYRGSEAFGNSCTRTMEPEDVTVGIIIGTSSVCYTYIYHTSHPHLGNDDYVASYV